MCYSNEYPKRALDALRSVQQHESHKHEVRKQWAAIVAPEVILLATTRDRKQTSSPAPTPATYDGVGGLASRVELLKDVLLDDDVPSRRLSKSNPGTEYAEDTQFR
jgi:hypothetical protein